MTRARPALAAGLAAFAVAAGAGCGGGADREPEVRPLGEVRVGSVAQLAQCRDWNAGTREQRLATIDEIQEQINLQDSAVQTPELADEDAYEVLDSSCSQEFADGFRLYKLYARATGFASFAGG